MRILQVVARYYPEIQFGGPPQKVHDLSRGLAQRGHRVQVVTFHSTQRIAAAVEWDGIEIRYLPWLGWRERQVPLDLGSLAAAVSESDVVHTYGLYNLLCPAAALLALRARLPYVLEPLGMYTPRARKLWAKRVYNRVFTSWMSRHAASVIATSPGEMAELAGLTDSRRLVLRRNGIDIDLYRALPPADKFRTSHGILDGERVILYVGRISPIKNLELLVLAFDAASLERACLVLVGPALEPDYLQKLVDLIGELNLEGRVLLAGPLYGEDKLCALAAADLFVLPSFMESYGNAAAEAVAAGVPVLLTEGCGIAPQIDGRAGMVVSATVSALKQGLHSMIEDRTVRESLTKQMGQVTKELSWDEPLAQTEQLYEAVIGNGSQ
ncbi:MAG: glycosyltransferase [Anaerolineae bacterium]